ncbi:hypothetical protein CROQUDRAFT_49935 [Cronartium quercuum f. sp. fusiforme G11]|uniref:Mitochondrial K+-H+ exchange-related-domain-containing protein n=1 Tax=Cronartium quercuum f. sp. fusiforme G11 TaxID=708437 RepID=A0A9P6T8K4_9BASI|nr:hypothetical protein CROQUDRAFT_49935 [Cronartium quercuum f. sp. fusiforme G11]
MTAREALRLVALPLTRPHPGKSGLVYLYAQRTNLGSRESETAQKPWVNRITEIGSKQWLKMGSASVTSWKFKVYNTGESFMDRIPFEEWALKTIEPAFVAKPFESLKSDASTSQRPHGNNCKGSNAESTGHIELLYPRLLGPSDQLITWLSRTMAEREPYHRKWMRYNLLISPLTLPFAIVPIVPNLPFFYLMWRAWSHWRAYRASKYLNAMIHNRLIIPRQSKILDMVYDGAETVKNPQNELILTKAMSVRLKDEFQWPEHSERELARAIEQASLRLSGEKMVV